MKILSYCTALRRHVPVELLSLGGQPEGKHQAATFLCRLESQNGETTELSDSVTTYMHVKSSETTYLQACEL